MKRSGKSIRLRTILVLAVVLIFAIAGCIMYRANYLETLEIGEEYVEVFNQNVKYRLYIGLVNFIVIFIIVYITNCLIKKGLKKFFDEEKKEMPKLPNKSLAFVVALVSSIIVSNLFLQKAILFVNTAWFGVTDPIFGSDIGFYIFQSPFIGQLLYYGAVVVVGLTAYTAVYYIAILNKYFDGVDGKTLRGNTFIKQILFNIMMLVIFIALIICFNVQNMETGNFLTLDDTAKTTIIGSGAVDGIKLWGYRILSIVIIISVYLAIRAFKKNSTKKVIKSLAIVPIYMIAFFVVLVGYNLLFVNGSELDKQKTYISTNINFTRTAYDVNINEETIENTGTITEEEAEKNQNVINNIPVVTEDIVTNNLLQTQTSTGYYTYSKAKASIYDNEIVYVAARELRRWT